MNMVIRPFALSSPTLKETPTPFITFLGFWPQGFTQHPPPVGQFPLRLRLVGFDQGADPKEEAGVAMAQTKDANKKKRCRTSLFFFVSSG